MRAASDPLVVVGSRSHRGDSLDGLLAKLGPHELRPMGSALKFCLVAEGAADFYPRLGPTSEWDTAAAQAVLEVAGGAVTTLDGAPLRYNARDTLLNPHFIAVRRPHAGLAVALLTDGTLVDAALFLVLLVAVDLVLARQPRRRASAPTTRHSRPAAAPAPACLTARSHSAACASCATGGGPLQLERTYVFDYTRDGYTRQQGFVVLTGHGVDSVGL